MGLSSKQVISSDGVDWTQTLLRTQTLQLPIKPTSSMRRQNQQNQQQQNLSEPLKCPRCDSSNTKFCYYNNYNKSQPRHFCRACKRHWTKGGTLRNVPVGGGRKNKRPKKSTAAASAATTTAAGNTSNNVSGIFYNQGLIGRSSSSSSSPLPQQSLMSSNNHINTSTSFLLSLPLISNSTSFDSKTAFPTSSSSNNAYHYADHLHDFKHLISSEPPSIVPSTTAGSTIQPPLQVPISTDMSNYWNWEDIDNLVSTDLNLPWDDSDIKP